MAHSSTAVPDPSRTPNPTAALAAAGRHVRHMGWRSSTVQRRLRKARGRLQWSKARCLDGILSRLHALERTAAADHLRLEASVDLARRWGRAVDLGPDLARYETWTRRSKALLAQAGACGRRHRLVWPMQSGTVVRVVRPRLPTFVWYERR